MSAGRIPVLITATGGDMGQTLVRALRLSSDAFALHGCDADCAGIGPAFVEAFHQVPLAREPDHFIHKIEALCRRFGLAAVIPSSDAEMEVLSQHARGGRLNCGAAVICQPVTWRATYGDKLTCQRDLEGKLALAGFADGCDAAEVQKLLERTDFPLVVKARRSTGSRSIAICRNQAELEHHLQHMPLPLVQEYLDDSGGEYSVGVFACKQFLTAIAHRRQLSPLGCTWYAETAEDAEVVHYALRAAQASRLNGSANVQVRKTAHGVRLLEINPRFSSLTAARAASGFYDVAWSLHTALNLPLSSPPEKYQPLRFRRYLGTLVDFGSGFQALEGGLLPRHTVPV